ncbi:MAG: penicillin-binding transpeptidase domain-containing protein [Myxococcales bacterium]
MPTWIVALVLLAAESGIAAPRRCFVLREVGKGDLVRKGGDECKKRSTPASTFKIPHALVALETGVVGEEEKLTMPPNRTFPRWGGEHTLRSATHDSVLTFFQAIARRIGPEREKEWLRKLRYGNEDASGPVDQFWLNGTLRISPDEQVSFLEKLVAGKLPVSRHAVEYVRSSVTHPAGTYFATGADHTIAGWPPGATLWAKSGFSGGKERVSWYVGGVERDGRQWVFASRIEGAREAGDAAADAIREIDAVFRPDPDAAR